MNIVEYQVKAIKRLCGILGQFALHWIDRTDSTPPKGGKWEPQSSFEEKALRFMRAKNVNGCDLFGRLPETWAVFDDLKKGALRGIKAVWIETSRDNYQALVHFDRQPTKDEYSHLKRAFGADPGANGQMFRLPGFVNRKRALKGQGEFMARLATLEDEVPVTILDDLLKRTRYVAPVLYTAPSVPTTQRKKKGRETTDQLWERCVSSKPDRSSAEYLFCLNLMNQGWNDDEVEAELENRFDPEAHNQKKGDDYIATTVKNARRTWRPPTSPRVRVPKTKPPVIDRGGWER